MKYYTYAHYTADTNELFYVGKGSSDRSTKTQNRNRWWHNKVKKHGGFTVKILAYWKTEKEALEHEKFLIDCFDSISVPLVNIFKSIGKETEGKKLSTQTRNKMSESRKKYLEARTEEQIKQWSAMISSYSKGKKKTEEHKLNLSKAKKGKQVPKQWKPIFCKTNGKTYKSVTEAAEDTGCFATHISKVCRGKIKQTKNMEFSYV
jgi:hypothetical protein